MYSHSQSFKDLGTMVERLSRLSDEPYADVCRISFTFCLDPAAQGQLNRANTVTQQYNKTELK